VAKRLKCEWCGRSNFSKKISFSGFGFCSPQCLFDFGHSKNILEKSLREALVEQKKETAVSGEKKRSKKSLVGFESKTGTEEKKPESNSIWVKHFPLKWGLVLSCAFFVFGGIQFIQQKQLNALNRQNKELKTLIKGFYSRGGAKKNEETHIIPVLKEEGLNHQSKEKPNFRYRKLKYTKSNLGFIYAAEQGDFSRGDTRIKWLALTFDGGAHLEGADEILDTLKNRKINATFFLTGRFIKKNPALINRILDEGHEIGNHTYSQPRLTTYADNGKHQLLPKITQAYLKRELQKTNDVFKHITGKGMIPFWRAPYGEHNRILRGWGQLSGWQHIGWTQGSTWRATMDTNDWVADSTHSGYFSASEIKRKVIQFGSHTSIGPNGAIILMHLGTLRKKDQAFRVLGEIIDFYLSKNFKWVKVSHMFSETKLLS